MSKKERLIDDDLQKTKDTEALRDLFYSKRTGLGSFDKLWRKVKKDTPRHPHPTPHTPHPIPHI